MQKLNINLVKSFLTSIKFTFDSLSRKIKNPCLVINKNFLKEDFTMKSKQIIIMLLSVLVFAFTSCKSNENPGGGGSAPSPFKPSELVGTWQSQADTGTSFTIAANGEIDYGSGVKATITDWTKNKDTTVTKFDVVLTFNFTSGQDEVTFSFTSSTTCNATLKSKPGVYEPFKKQ